MKPENVQAKNHSTPLVTSTSRPLEHAVSYGTALMSVPCLGQTSRSPGERFILVTRPEILIEFLDT
eukprot:scaffold13283_cov82-Cyclotella_meneghiniana.AAC.3